MLSKSYGNTAQLELPRGCVCIAKVDFSDGC